MGKQQASTNYRGISLLSFPGKVYQNALKGNAIKLWNSNWRMDSAVSVQVAAPLKILTLKQIFEKSWEYDKNLFACFADLEKAYDRVP